MLHHRVVRVVVSHHLHHHEAVGVLQVLALLEGELLLLRVHVREAEVRQRCKRTIAPELLLPVDAVEVDLGVLHFLVEDLEAALHVQLHVNEVEEVFDLVGEEVPELRVAGDDVAAQVADAQAVGLVPGVQLGGQAAVKCK